MTADTLFFLMFIVCVKINLLEQSNNPIFTLEWKTGDKRPHPTTIDQYAFVLTLHFFHFHVKVYLGEGYNDDRALQIETGISYYWKIS